MDLEKEDARVWPGFNWLRKGAGALVNVVMNLRLP
jgi:hypothetical protein